ncbi:hypothetical protein MCOR31_005985 [Pyricularia oryzae]|nr:hypothetical protein MCOR31_005985 [Pyricularia oryzae]
MRWSVGRIAPQYSSCSGSVPAARPVIHGCSSESRSSVELSPRRRRAPTAQRGRAKPSSWAAVSSKCVPVAGDRRMRA